MAQQSDAGAVLHAVAKRFARGPVGTTITRLLPLLAASPFLVQLGYSSDVRMQPFQTILSLQFFTAVLAFATTALVLQLLYRQLLGRPVYLLDVCPYRPADSLKVTWGELAKRADFLKYSDENRLFQKKIAFLSGVGPETFMSPGLKHMITTGEKPASTHAACMEEAEMVMFAVVEGVLKQTGIHPSEVDVVVTTSTIFAPTPTLASMIIHRFKMRTDTIGYSLAGQGCSSGVVCTELGNQILQGAPNKVVLIVAHENITNSFYEGQHRSFLISNLLFREGGAACLMSNRPKDRRIAKYQLQAHARMHCAADTSSFEVIQGRDDPDGVRGIYLSRNILPVSSRAIKENLRRMGIQALPLAELLRSALDPKYMPDFRSAFEHFLIHTGSKTVIDSVGANLKLPQKLIDPSSETLWFYGNTCVASTFYILANVETRTGVKRGERVLQLGFGTGFKCVSAAWVALRDIRTQHGAWTFETAYPMPPAGRADPALAAELDIPLAALGDLGDAFKQLERAG